MAEQQPYRERPVDTKRVYDGRVVKLDVETVELPDGRRAKREVVRHPGAVMVVPWLDGERVVLVRQFRYAAGATLLELPAGLLDREAESPAACAARELTEETGYVAAQIEPVATFFTTPGFTDEQIHCFRATGLRPAGQDLDADESLEVVVVRYAEALAMIRRGEIRDGKTIVGLWLGRELGGL